VVHAGSKNNRPRVHLDDLNYQTREFNNFAAYAEAKVANILYMKELAARLHGTGVTTASVHPGWARSNFGSGGSRATRAMMALITPLRPFVTNSNEESAQTTLHCLLSDDAPKHSGAYFSQQSVLYRDRECRKGGWPMESPNPHAKDMDTARKLVDLSNGLVGLETPTR
jgi:retinol dehydrogenase-13